MLFLIVIAFAVDWGTYNFYNNVGGIFYDYSGNSYHGINGQEVLQDPKDVKLTDRGAYFDGSSSLITLHNTIWTTPILETNWKLYFWVKPFSAGPIFTRTDTDSSSYIFLFLKDDDYIELELGSVDSSDGLSLQSHTSASTYSLDNWNFIIVSVQSDCSSYSISFVVEINDQALSLQSGIGSVCYKQLLAATTIIGAAPSSFQGLIYDTRFSDQNSLKDDNDQFHSSCGIDLCYFGSDATRCLCTDCAGQVCISNQNDLQASANGSLCVACSGMCRATSTCAECPTSSWPVCETDGTSYSSELCHSDCGGCFGPNQNQCLTCASTYANLVNGSCSCPQNSLQINQTCMCLYGYGLVPQNGEYTCQPCESPCQTCSGTTSYCMSCQDQRANVVSGECQCPYNASMVEGVCECNDGYFSACDICSSLRCWRCDSSCQTCDGHFQTDCLTCSESEILMEDSSCFGCEEGQYIDESLECTDCFKDCLNCSSKYVCTECVHQNKTVTDSGECQFECETGFYSGREGCVQCPSLCVNCMHDGLCLSCVDNADWLGYFCQCKEGYHQENSVCVLSNITCSINTENIKKIELIFTKELDRKLTEDHLQIDIKYEPEFEYQIEKDGLVYILEINYKDKIPKGSDITVKFKRQLRGVDGSYLATEKVTGELEEYTPENIEMIELSVMIICSIFITLSYIGLVIGPGCSPLWTLVTSMQFLAYLPLSSNKMVGELRAFLISLNQWNIVPNIFQFTIDNSGARPYTEAYMYGIQNNDFIINCGKQIVILLFLIFIAVVLKLLSYSQKMKGSEKFNKIYTEYFYSAFLRFWIVFYMDFAVYSFIRVLDVTTIQVNENSFFSVLDNLSASITLSVIPIQLLVILCPIFQFFFVMINKPKLENPSQVKFNKKWSTLVSEFDISKKLIYNQYYLIFFFRRFLTVGTLILLKNYPISQNISISAYSILFLLYLLKYSPFQYRLLKILNTGLQVSTNLILLFLIFFTLDLQYNTKLVLGYFIIFIFSTTFILSIVFICYIMTTGYKTPPTFQIQQEEPSIQKVDCTQHSNIGDFVFGGKFYQEVKSTSTKEVVVLDSDHIKKVRNRSAYNQMMNLEARFQERIENYQQSLTLDQAYRKREQFAVTLRKKRRTQEHFQKRKMHQPLFQVDQEWILTKCAQYYQFEGSKRVRKLFELIQASPTNQDTQYFLQLLCNLTKTGSFQVMQQASKTEFLLIIKKILTQGFSDKTVGLACWILANLIWGSAAIAKQLAQLNFIEILLRVLQIDREQSIEQALWALCNLSGDNQVFRNYVLDLNGLLYIKTLIQPLKARNAQSCLTCLSWFQANLSRGQKCLTIEQSQTLIENVLDLWENQDSELVHNCLNALQGISHTDLNGSTKIMQNQVLSLVLQSLRSSVRRVVKPALMIVGNIIAKSNQHTQELLKLNILNELVPFVSINVEYFRKQTFYILSNIVGGPVQHIQIFLNHPISGLSLQGLLDPGFNPRYEASFIFSNIAQAGNSSLILQLLNTEFLSYASKFLQNQESRLLTNMMITLEGLIKAAREQVKEIDYLLYELGVVDKIQDLQTHSNNNVSQKALQILTEYFEIEEDEVPYFH